MPVSDHLKSIVRARWARTPPSDWTYHRIGDVLEKKARRVDVEDSVLYKQPVIRRGHGGIEVRERQYGRDILTKRQYRLHAGDWLMSKVQILHEAYGIVPDELDGAIASGSYYAFEPAEHLDLQYLWYLSHHPAFHESCALASVGVVIEKMVFRVKDWLDFQILLPPLKEQQKIAAILSSVDDATAATRKVIEQTKRVKKGLLQTLMTCGIGRAQFKKTEIGEIPEEWEVVHLADVAELQTGPFGSQLKASEYTETGIPVVMPSDLNRGRVDTKDIARVPPEVTDRLSKHRFHEGDIVFARRGDIGRSALITTDEAGWLCGTGCLRARPSDRFDSRFLLLAVSRHWSCQWLEANALGQTMLNLNTSILGGLPVPLPPLEEQQEIRVRIECLDRQIDDGLTQTLRLELLKRGLMQDLLTGRVRVQPD